MDRKEIVGKMEKIADGIPSKEKYTLIIEMKSHDALMLEGLLSGIPETDEKFKTELITEIFHQGMVKIATDLKNTLDKKYSM